jgi:hypothetical protein
MTVMINNIKDILEVIVDQVLTKVSVMPFCVRIFCKFIYDECHNKYKDKMSQEQLYGIVAEFLFPGWLLKVCFEELNMYGFTKTFIIPENCRQNFKLLSTVMIH